MSTVSASSGVKLKASSGALSGSTTLTGTDNNGNKSTLATINASGTPTKGGNGFSAGSNNNWYLTVTYKANGTATGSAAGSWSGITSAAVPVEVDAPGRSHHGRKQVKKTKSRKQSSPKKRTSKASTNKRSTARGAKKPARKARRRR